MALPLWAGIPSFPNYSQFTGGDNIQKSLAVCPLLAEFPVGIFRSNTQKL
jgi:hypothetical protein